MGQQKPASHYDAIYQRSENYRLEPKSAPWYPIWAEVARIVPETASVFDVGCGPGHMAQVLRGKVKSYSGIDFSGAAIKQARARVPGVTFRWNDAFDFDWPDADYYLFLEVLEHLDDDIGLLQKVPRGKNVILSVPNADSANHVRHFLSVEAVRKRYGGTLKLSNVYKVGDQWYIAEGVKS